MKTAETIVRLLHDCNFLRIDLMALYSEAQSREAMIVAELLLEKAAWIEQKVKFLQAGDVEK